LAIKSQALPGRFSCWLVGWLVGWLDSAMMIVFGVKRILFDELMMIDFLLNSKIHFIRQEVYYQTSKILETLEVF